MQTEMTLDQAMRERRSVRHYQEKEVSDDVLKEVLELASWAPSPGNTQSWNVVALSHEVSRQVIERFELAGWESVFPVLRQVMRDAESSRPSGEPEPGDDAAGPVDWTRRVLGTYHRHFEVRGSPRLLFIYRKRDPRRYVDLFSLSVKTLWDRAREGRSVVAGVVSFRSALGNVPNLMRVNALTRTVGLANFTYAVTLAAYARGLSTCIQSNYLNVHPRLHRYLGLGDEVDIVASVLIGYGDRGASPVPEMFRTRRPVPVDWIQRLPTEQPAARGRAPR